MISPDDNPAGFITQLLLVRGNEYDNQFTASEDTVTAPSDVKFFAQDASGEWYGYKDKPDWVSGRDIWESPRSKNMGYIFLGKTELYPNHDIKCYEVTP